MPNKTPKQSAASDTLMKVDNPDDFTYEGAKSQGSTNIQANSQGDEPYVVVDNPDDFE